jgi:hypothetical protein
MFRHFDRRRSRLFLVSFVIIVFFLLLFVPLLV